MASHMALVLSIAFRTHLCVLHVLKPIDSSNCCVGHACLHVVHVLSDCPSIPISAGSSRFHSFYPVSRRSPQRGIQNPAFDTFSRSKPYDRCKHMRAQRARMYTIYCTTVYNRVNARSFVYYTVLYLRGNARSFVAQRIQCTCIYIYVYVIFNYVASKSRVTAGSLRGMVANLDRLYSCEWFLKQLFVWLYNLSVTFLKKTKHKDCLLWSCQ